MNIELELKEADRQIDEARDRITMQDQIISGLEIEGSDVSEALALLTGLENAVRALMARRGQIVRGARGSAASTAGVATEKKVITAPPGGRGSSDAFRSKRAA
jgi:hypothetical protein